MRARKYRTWEKRKATIPGPRALQALESPISFVSRFTSNRPAPKNLRFKENSRPLRCSRTPDIGLFRITRDHCYSLPSFESQLARHFAMPACRAKGVTFHVRPPSRRFPLCNVVLREPRGPRERSVDQHISCCGRPDLDDRASSLPFHKKPSEQRKLRGFQLSRERYRPCIIKILGGAAFHPSQFKCPRLTISCLPQFSRLGNVNDSRLTPEIGSARGIYRPDDCHSHEEPRSAGYQCNPFCVGPTSR